MIDTVASGMSATRKKKNKNDYLLEMNEKDKEINHKIIKNMNKRVNYLKNPRFKINKAPVLFSYLTTKQVPPHRLYPLGHRHQQRRRNAVPHPTKTSYLPRLYA